MLQKVKGSLLGCALRAAGMFGEFKTEAFRIIAHKFTQIQWHIIENCGCLFLSVRAPS